LRTNVELLMAAMAPGAPRLPEDEMSGLRADVLAQIEELSTLVGDLVDLTRDDAGEVVHEPVDMSEVIDRSLERVRRRRNDIEFDVDVIGWQVYGAAPALSRAMLNLLDNAAKWSPSGGRVRVRLRQVDPLHAELVVADLGPGIPPQERRLVFERFYRSASARALPGSGLGLAIVKHVVLKHGGLIRVEDTVPGGHPPGTSIYVLLPGSPVGLPASAQLDELAGVTAGSGGGGNTGASGGGNGEKSRNLSSKISVDSQSKGTR
jgi:two-component system sensor histidine kinase MprB